jgi:cytochrome oxidase Cu insertion factor (SCO1/SenC/PrrC family)
MLRVFFGLACFIALIVLGLTATANAHDKPSPRPETASLGPGAPGPGRTAEFDYDPPIPGTYDLPELRDAVDGAVLDTKGTPRRLLDVLKGKITLLSFIYTNCGDARGCPLATSVLADVFQASAREPDLVENVRLVTLSFDPRHDTPPAMAAYATPLLAALEGRPQSEWTFLTTASERDLDPILAGYDQLVVKNLGPDKVFDGTFEHLLRVYLIDRAGRVRNIYGVSLLDPRLLVADAKTLFLEERGVARR